MNNNIFDFLKTYGTDTYSIDRLLVSSYLHIKELTKIKNKKIKKLIIKNDELEYPDLVKFIDLIKEVDREFSFEELLELFEFVISPSDKLVNGAIYTPTKIREYITNQCFLDYRTDNYNDIKIADISCGCGGFLIDASKKLKEKTNNTYKDIFRDNIFGIDIQDYSIERTKILLSLVAIEEGDDDEIFEFNLYVEDSLVFKFKEEDQKVKDSDGFDLILGNPPYVCSRNMDEKTKSLMSEWKTSSTGHPDLYIPFFQIGYELLKEDGILGFITVNSFIKSVNGRAIRKYFSENKVDLKIIDFEGEQVFNSRMTYTCICFLSNKNSEKLYYKKSSSKDLNHDFIYDENNYSELEDTIGWYLKNRNFVKKIEATGIQFGELYNTKSGIATLKNSVYIFNPNREDEEFYYIDDNIKIEKEICRNVVNSNLLIKINTVDNIIEKLIFPYLYDEENKIRVMEEETFRNKYPFAFSYLEDNKDLLYLRDKGKGKDYKHWYAFGRNQSLEKFKYKLLFPQLAKEGFQSCISSDENLYFYNGMAAMSNSIEELKLLEKVFQTEIFWKYVTSISKNYASNYFSLGRNYIKYFGIYNFNEKEKEYIIKENDTNKLNKYINNKYNSKERNIK